MLSVISILSLGASFRSFFVDPPPPRHFAGDLEAAAATVSEEAATMPPSFARCFDLLYGRLRRLLGGAVRGGKAVVPQRWVVQGGGGANRVHSDRKGTSHQCQNLFVLCNVVGLWESIALWGWLNVPITKHESVTYPT